MGDSHVGDLEAHAFNIVANLSTIEAVVDLVCDLSLFRSALHYIYPHIVDINEVDMTYFVEIVAYLWIIKKKLKIDVNDYITVGDTSDTKFINFVEILKCGIDNFTNDEMIVINGLCTRLTSLHNKSPDRFLIPFWNNTPLIFMDFHEITSVDGCLKINVYYVKTAEQAEESCDESSDESSDTSVCGYPCVSEELPHSDASVSVYEMLTDKIYGHDLSLILSYIQNMLGKELLADELLAKVFSNVTFQVYFITNESRRHSVHLTDTNIYSIPLTSLHAINERDGFDERLREFAAMNPKIPTTSLRSSSYNKISKTLNSLPYSPIKQAINYLAIYFNL